MKKSTLITTIAMIVVVVVALSTATYAWFTSSSTSTAGGEISVTSDAKWSIMGATRTTTTSDEVAFDAGTPISMVLMNGLYSPTAAINATFTNNEYGYSTHFGTLSTWYEALQKGTGRKGTAEITSAASVNAGVATDSSVNYVRVENADKDPQSLTLTITVTIPATASSVQIEAAENLCLYAAIYLQTGASEATQYTANTAYDYGSLTNSTASKATAVNAFDVPASTTAGSTIAAAGTGTEGAIEWKTADNNTNKLLAKYVTGGSDITEGIKYYQRNIVIGNVGAGYGVNVAMYTWFNGWRIDSTVGTFAANVYLAFGNSAS